MPLQNKREFTHTQVIPWNVTCIIGTQIHFPCEEMPLRVHLYSEGQLALIQVHRHVSTPNKPRQLVEVHRVTTPLCKMCRECFDWQLCYLGLTVPSNKWPWQLLLRRFPSPRPRTLTHYSANQGGPPSTLSPGNLFGVDRIVRVCMCEGCSPRGTLILHSGFRLEIKHCLARGPAIKPLKRPVRTISQVCLQDSLPFMHTTHQWTSLHVSGHILTLKWQSGEPEGLKVVSLSDWCILCLCAMKVEEVNREPLETAFKYYHPRHYF